jgi:hypothetical protein
MNAVRDILLQRLTDKGLSRDMLPGFIRNLTRTIYSNPDISLRELNRRLDWLGWNQIEIDMHTLDLILADGALQDIGPIPPQTERRRAGSH